MIKDHILETAQQLPIENVGGIIKPKFICLSVVGMERGIYLANYVEDAARKESTHLFVDSKGEITQFAPFNVKTWHAGSSYWQGYHGLNGFSIGVVVERPMSGDSMQTLHRVLPVLIAEYNIRDIVNIVRYPYGEFDLTQYKGYVEYGNADSAGRFVATGAINIYMGPGTGFEIADRIEEGEGVKVLRYSVDKEWAHVLYTRSDNLMKCGWTHESFLRRL